MAGLLGGGGLAGTVRDQWLQGALPLAKQYAIPISYLSTVAEKESNNQNIRQQVNSTGSAFGPFQFTKGTWADQIRRHPELGLTEDDRFNPAAQGRAMVTFTRDNQQALRGILKRDPSPGELLLAHRLGAQGAAQLLTAPRNTPVAQLLPDAAAANPQWRNLTAEQLLAQTNKAAGASEPMMEPTMIESPPTGGLLGKAPTSPVAGDNGAGLAALFAGQPLAPFGTGLQNMTPEFKSILATALLDPTLGPTALQTVLQIGLDQSTTTAKQGKVTEKITNALAAGLRPGTPEWQQALVGGENAPKPTDIMKEAAALYPNDPAAQRDFIKSYREKTTGVTVQNIPQALPVNKAVAEKFEGDIANADSARTALGRIEAARAALEKINTGAGAGIVANVGSYLRSAGIDPATFGIPDTASAAEALNAISAPMILELRGTGKGGEGGMPGALSDNDLKFLRSSTINLESQPGANRAILMLQERIQQRKLQLEELAANHAEANNGQVAGSYLNERRKFVNSHPLFDDAFKKQFEAALATPIAPVTAPAAGAQKAPTITAVPPGTPASPGGTAPKRWILKGGQLVPE